MSMFCLRNIVFCLHEMFCLRDKFCVFVCFVCVTNYVVTM